MLYNVCASIWVMSSYRRENQFLRHDQFLDHALFFNRKKHEIYCFYITNENPWTYLSVAISMKNSKGPKNCCRYSLTDQPFYICIYTNLCSGSRISLTTWWRSWRSTRATWRKSLTNGRTRWGTRRRKQKSCCIKCCQGNCIICVELL